MKRYNIYGRVKASAGDPDAQTREFTELANKGKKIKQLSFYQNQLSRLTQKVYQPATFTLEKPTDENIQQELKEIAECKFYKLFGDNTDDVLNFVSQNQRGELERRESAWKEVKDFFDMIEADKAECENGKYLDEYNQEYSNQEAFIIGETSYVETALDTIFSNISLPFDCTVEVNYKQKNQKAEINVEIPTILNIPTLKTNISATYGRVSLKNKLIKEQDDDNSTCIIGLTYYLATLVFSASANILQIEISIWEQGKTNGLFWTSIKRDDISSTGKFNPLVDVFNWDYIANLRLLRGGTRLEPTPSQLFLKNISMRKEQS